MSSKVRVGGVEEDTPVLKKGRADQLPLSYYGRGLFGGTTSYPPCMRRVSGKISVAAATPPPSCLYRGIQDYIQREVYILSIYNITVVNTLYSLSLYRGSARARGDLQKEHL